MPFDLSGLLERIRSPWRKSGRSQQATSVLEPAADDEDFAYQLQAHLINASDSDSPVPATMPGDLPDGFEGYRRNGKLFSVRATDSRGSIVGMTLGWVCECPGRPDGIVIKACEVNPPWDQTPLRQVMVEHMVKAASEELGITKFDGDAARDFQIKPVR